MSEVELRQGCQWQVNSQQWLCYNRHPRSRLRLQQYHPVWYVGEWLSLVEHLVRDQGVGGSNPLSPTTVSQLLTTWRTVRIEPLVRLLWVPQTKCRIQQGFSGDLS
jgi:hypothetical protein